MDAFKKKLKRIIDGQIVAKNTSKNAQSCLQTLLLIFTNASKNPSNPKFRQIRGRGKVILQVLSCDGGSDTLLTVGFVKSIKEFEEFFTLPIGDFNIEHQLKEVIHIVESYIETVERNLATENTVVNKQLQGSIL
jgi:PUB domain